MSHHRAHSAMRKLWASACSMQTLPGLCCMPVLVAGVRSCAAPCSSTVPILTHGPAGRLGSVQVTKLHAHLKLTCGSIHSSPHSTTCAGGQQRFTIELSCFPNSFAAGGILSAMASPSAMIDAH